jgi:peptidyl-prolyl cis-trans isomerase A (cyclophilin A)
VSRYISIVFDAWKEVKVSPRKKTASFQTVCGFACLSLLGLTFAGGCGKPSAEDDSSPTAAINKSEQTGSTSGGTQAGAKKLDPLHPVILVETTMGNIKIRLDAEKSQITVTNFLSYVRESFYSQTIVHQVYKGQGILAGGYDVGRKENPVRTPIRNEAENGLKNRRGTIAMVRQPNAIDSATTQFMINVADNSALDFKKSSTDDPQAYGYCVFGEVIEGMDVVDKINESPVEDIGDFERTPSPLIIINSIRKIL